MRDLPIIGLHDLHPIFRVGFVRHSPCARCLLPGGACVVPGMALGQYFPAYQLQQVGHSKHLVLIPGSTFFLAKLFLPQRAGFSTEKLGNINHCFFRYRRINKPINRPWGARRDKAVFYYAGLFFQGFKQIFVFGLSSYWFSPRKEKKSSRLFSE